MIRVFLAALLLIPTLLYGQNLQKATFAAGCFWCTEEAFDKLPGVLSTTSGYMGGQKKHPTYEEVSAGITGQDRKSTRLNSSHLVISYAVFCLKKKKKQTQNYHLLLQY